MRDPQSGFSLVEAVLSAALILVITVGIMPLFTNSIVQNVQGKESTESTNFSRSGSEFLYPLPLDRPQVRPDVGDDEAVTCAQYTDKDGWKPYACGADPTGEPEWLRRSEVQQFNINEIYDSDTKNGEPTFKNPVTGYSLGNDELDSFVHIRQLIVTTSGQRDGGALGPGRRVDLVDVRGF